MLDICLLGTGGLRPLPNRFLTSLYIKCQGHGVLIDCGEGTQIALGKAECKFSDIDLILITHFHADHVAGLPGLLLTMGIMKRTRPVTVAGPKGLYKILQSLMTISGGLPFDVYVEEIEDFSAPMILGNMTIGAFPLSHRISCFGYRIEVPRGGKFLPSKASSLGIPKEYWKILQSGESITVDNRKVTPSEVLGPPRKGLKIVYATDTSPLSSIAEEGTGADLMILEGLYGETEKADIANQRGHMIFAQAAALAKDADAAELWLTHFSPALPVPEDFLPTAREIFPHTFAGFDGMKKTLKFCD